MINYLAFPGLKSRWTKKNKIPLEVIKSISIEFADMPEKKLFGKCRETECVEVRFMFYYYCRHVQRYSFPAIGNFTNKHHTSVIHGFNQVENFAETDYDFKRKLSDYLDFMRVKSEKYYYQ